MLQDSIHLEPSWLKRLEPEFQKPYMEHLRAFLKSEKQGEKVLFPPGPQIFAALDSTPFERVRVVILGQDPYHGPGQAHGLCFSVPLGVAPPPSLVNIFKERDVDLGLPYPKHGNLGAWAQQGVLLLNSVLTVEAHRAASHQGKGWETFTDRIVELLSNEKSNLVFFLWGRYAQNKGAAIDREKHLVLQAPHPSPLSAYRGFLGSRPFSRCNEYLRDKGLPLIDWKL